MKMLNHLKQAFVFRCKHLKMHPSIIQTGSQLKSTTGNGLQLGCPLCPKFTTTRTKTICRHLESHIKNAVNSQGRVICRCNLPCRDTGHYHCPHCEKTIMRKEDMTLHVTGCQKTCNRVPPSAEIRPPVSSSLSSSFLTPRASQQRSAQPPSEHHPPCSAGEDSLAFDHCYTFSPSCQPPSAPPPEASEPPAESSSKEEAADAAQSEATELPSSRVIYLKSVKCPHCSVVLYKKNLSVHIQRKHAKQKDIIAASHSKTKCADKARGLFYIPKGIHV